MRALTGRARRVLVRSKTLASSTVAANDPLVHVAFNRDARYLVAATSSGIRVFSCSPRLEHAFSRSGFASPGAGAGAAGEVTSADLGPTGPSGFLLAIVFGNTIRYWSEPDGQMTMTSPSTHGAVRAVRHVGDHVVVAGEDRTTLHEISRYGAKQIMQVDTGPNPLGACALAQVEGGRAFVLACPSPAIGDVHVWHGSNGARVDVHAHNSTVACLELSGDGQLLATADSTGTVLRIFSTIDGLTLQELVRGCARAEIHSIVFSPDYKWLAVSSDYAAVDMFSVRVDLTPCAPAGGDAAPMPTDATCDLPPHTRASMVARFTAMWPAAVLRLNEGVRYTAGFGQEPNTILVVGVDGSFYRCQFDPIKGHMKQVEHKDFMKME